MNAPPTKRRKTRAVLSSRDNEDATALSAGQSNVQEHGTNHATKELALRSRTRSGQGFTRSREPTALPRSPKKQAPRGTRTRTQTRNGSKDRSVNDFLNSSFEQKMFAQQLDLFDLDQLEDAIEDDSVLEEELRSQGTDFVVAGEAASKQARPADIPLVHKKGRSVGLKKFLPKDNASNLAAVPSTSASPRHVGEDTRPWVDRYCPLDLDELAVHPKKVDDVRRWILGSFAGQSQKKLLVLKGPSGSGKSTTVSLLSEVLDFDVLEWQNPGARDAQSLEGASALSQLQDFISRGARFDSLEMRSRPDAVGRAPARSRPRTPNSNKNKLILMEEYPNTFTSSSLSLRSFRSIVQQFLVFDPSPTAMATSTAARKPSIPMVMIVSETVLTASSADSFTVHRLLGPDILGHAAVSVIEFNPVARTLLAKALDLVAQKDARCSGRRNMPGPNVMERLGEVGDIRSAIGSLQMLCLRGDNPDSWGQRVALSKPKRNTRSQVPLTRTEKDSLEVITQREASLGVFHAVGKVVYNKRDELPQSELVASEWPQPPDHLACHARPKRCPLVVDDLMDQTGTDVRTFICALHENYVPSCSTPLTAASMDTVNSCIDALSDCDLLDMSSEAFASHGSRRTGLFRTGFDGAGRDGLRQDEITFQTAVRGILFALPSPVRRQMPSMPRPQGRRGAPPKTGSADAFKMFYPVSLKLWRRREELESIIGSVSGRLSGAILPQDLVPPSAAKQPGTVESWVQEGSRVTSRRSGNRESSKHAGAGWVPSRGGSAQLELVLERLPYLAKILKNTPQAAYPLVAQLDTLTVFKGLGIPVEDGSDDEIDVEKELSSTKTWESKKFLVDSTTEKDGGNKIDEEQKLFLSDDDIED